MKKRILSLLLVVLMFVGAIPVASTYASENAEELSVWLVDDSGAEQPAEDVALYRGGAVRLAAHRGVAVSGDVRWQIASGDEWINIQGATADTLRVSYGMVAALLVDDTARLRCTVGEFESKAVTIRVTEENPAPAEPAETLSAPEPLPAPEATVTEPVTPETEPTPEAESTPETEPTPEDEVEAEPTPEAGPTPELTGEEGIAPMALADAPQQTPLGAVAPVKTYTVTFFYVYAPGTDHEGENVAQPYVAQFAEGWSGNVTATSPNLVGYAPDEAEHTESITALDRDIVRTIYYRPAMVSYSVRHYLQNVEDDEYTLETTTMVSGYTEAMTSTEAAAQNYAGFTALSHVNEQIAADGSTVVDIYYDRNYYMFSFDLDGGYGVEPVYARCGASISVGTPTKAGYSFGGWTLNDVSVQLPVTMPAENRSYKATWNVGDADYKLSYWLENPNDDGYSYVGSVTKSAQSGSAVSGSDSAVANGVFQESEAQYYSYNPEKTDKDVVISGDGTSVVRVYYTRNQYKLRFYYARSYRNNTNYQVATVTGGSSNSDFTDTNNVVSAAGWNGAFNALPVLESGYTSGQEDLGGTYRYYYIDLTAKYGQNLETLWPNAPFEADANGYHAGGRYKFISWGTRKGSGYYANNTNKNIKGVYSTMDDDLIIDPAKTEDKGVNHILVGYWNQNPSSYTYEIYYSLLDGETAGRTYDGVGYHKHADYIVGSTDAPRGQTALSFQGVSFIGMDYDGRNERPENGGTGVVRFYYKRNEHTLSFYDNYGTTTETYNIPYGETVSKIVDRELRPEYPAALPKNAFVFGGWYPSPDCLDGMQLDLTDTSVIMPDKDLVYYAKWMPNTFTVTVRSDEGNAAPSLGETQTVAYNAMATEPTAALDAEKAKRTDDEFLGWRYKDENGVEHAFSFEGTPVTKDITVYAKWRSTKTCQVTVKYVTYDAAGNEIPVAKTESQHLVVGQLRTYSAKTGTALYPAYQTGAFPTVASQSVTPLAEDVENGLTVTFEYKLYEAVPYKVCFKIVDENGNEKPAFRQNGDTVEFVEAGAWQDSYTEYVEEHDDNNKAIVTELYVPEVLTEKGWSLPDGYVPNALRVEKVIVPGPENAYNDENTITFVYRCAEQRARYSVNHYIQNSAGAGYDTLYRHTDHEGTIGEMVSAGPITIAGYEYSHDVTDENKGTNTLQTVDGTDVLSGVVVRNHALELNFYYNAIEYPYQIMYLEQGTGQILAPTKTTDDQGRPLKARFGATVTADAIDINDYKPVKASESIVIQQEAQNAAGEYTASQNTIYLYYTPTSGGLSLSKTVSLDPKQAQEEGITALPDAVMAQEFQFTITAAAGFHKAVYSYTRTNANDPAGTVRPKETAVVNGLSLTVTLKAGDTITFDQLHLGKYTITEEFVPGFRSAVNGEVCSSVEVELANENETKTVTFDNRYPFYTGTLVVQKAVITQQGDPAPVGSYQVHVELFPDQEAREVDRTVTWTDASNTQQSLTIPKWKGDGTDKNEFSLDILVPAGTAAEPGHVELTGVPVGLFTAEETAVEGNVTDYYTVTYNYALHRNDETSGRGVLASGNIHGGHPTAVTFRNTTQKGGLTIEKTVTQAYANDSFQSDAFEFTVTGYSELPAGAYSVNDGAYTATVAANGNVTVKDASGNDPQITVTKGSTGTSWTQTLALTGLPAGKYTVTEVAKTGYTCQQENAQVTGLQVGGTTAPTAAFTNTFDRTSGDLTVSKTIELTKQDDGITIDSAQDFEFTLLLTDGTLSGSYSYTKGTENGALAVADGKLSFTLKHNESITINGLPVGKYRVLETKVAGYGSSFAAIAGDNDHTEAQVTLTTDEKKTVACVNSYPVDNGTLVVKKQVVTPAGYNAIDVAPADDRFQFVVSISGFDAKITSLESFVQSEFRDANGTALVTKPTVTVTQSDQSGTLSFTLGAGESVALTLPNGTFTVSETALVREAEPTARLADHYTTAYTVNGAAGTADQEYTLSGTTQPITAEFTNTYKRHYADLTIVTNAEGYSNQNFIFDVASVTDSTFKLQVILGNKDSRTIKDLPVGQYTVTERNDWSWREEAVAPQETTPFDLSTGSKTATFNYDAVDRTKWLSGYSYNIGKEG